MGISSLGAIAGGIIIGIWGGTKPRIHTIMPGIIISAFFLALVGVSQTAILLGVTLFLMDLPAPMINAIAMSLMQAKVAPDIQGRVFAALGQMATLLIPVAYLVVGPLADTVFEPAVGKAGLGIVAPLVGNTTGSGMGLMMVIAGGVLIDHDARSSTPSHASATWKPNCRITSPKRSRTTRRSSWQRLRRGLKQPHPACGTRVRFALRASTLST